MRLPSSLTALGALTVALAVSSCGASEDRPVTVFAASSLRPTLDEMGHAYTDASGQPITVVYGASSTMARQIAAGAPADVFVSADARWVTWLDERDHLDKSSIAAIATNTLAVVAPASSPFAWSPGRPLSAAFEGRLSLGDPAHVPAGRYAKAALEALGDWDAVKDRAVPAQDVRAALRFVETGSVGAAIVYGTDVATSQRVVLVSALPASLSPPITYVAAATRTQNAGASAAFVTWLRSASGRAQLERHGFGLPPEGQP